MARGKTAEAEHKVGDVVVSPDGKAEARLVEKAEGIADSPRGTSPGSVTYEVVRGVTPAGAGEAEAVRSRRLVAINVPPR